jgi:hypothetical protein
MIIKQVAQNNLKSLTWKVYASSPLLNSKHEFIMQSTPSLLAAFWMQTDAEGYADSIRKMHATWTVEVKDCNKY